MLLDQRRSTVLILLTHLFLVHRRSRLLLALPQASLRQVAGQIDFHRCFFHDGLTFISRNIVLN